MEFLEVQYLDIEESKEYEKVLGKVIGKCFEEERLKNLYISVILTNPQNIQKINKEYRNIDKPTDVLSFPMFEKDEIEKVCKTDLKGLQQVLGDVVISIEQVKKQAKEYGHSFERELSYMAVHGFYHLMGYDHMEEEEKKQMREKEENILSKLEINR